MKKSDSSILFLGKKDDAHCVKAAQFVHANFSDVTVCLGEWGESLPETATQWQGDFIISYLSRWVVPEHLIHEAKHAAINFHPASPDYPGIGCNNFALYEQAQEYGVTCHHMAAKVDTGAIIAVRRFPVFASDDVASLLQRTYEFQLVLFYDVLGGLIRNEPLPHSNEMWTRPPFTRKQFDALGLITADMSEDEVQRRVRATSFGIWQPRMEIAGHVFMRKEEPLATKLPDSES